MTITLQRKMLKHSSVINQQAINVKGHRDIDLMTSMTSVDL